ncbi:MAG TPA: DEAD/DEAH box helicase [Polyangiaceae bacterium]|jgi:hypothetical protein|nr:DEAD/DEAH box helicase [Polyangiaceae bacterium]
MGLFDKGAGGGEEKPASPRKLYDLLQPDPFGDAPKNLWGIQERVLDGYWPEAKDKKNVALELPTGSGKTLVGLLIGEFHRRVSGSRIAFLCPTRQLAYQTAERASLYGVPAVCLVGSKEEYDPAALNSYKRAKAIAVTTYSGVFNIKPAIDDAQIILCDDAHAGETYVSDQWSLKIDHKAHMALFLALLAFFGDAVNAGVRHSVGNGSVADVDLVPMPKYADRLADLRKLFDQHCFKGKDADLKFRWIGLKDHLHACSIFVSPVSILVRPLIPPTDEHAPFANANQRIFMSATLGDDGDLQRMYGIRKIHRVQDQDANEGNTGRRFILFPHLMKDEAVDEVHKKVVESGRCLFIVSGGQKQTLFVNKWLKRRQIKTLYAGDVEESLEPFVSSNVPTALVLTNRYDGIDLPGEQCRRMLLYGAPSSQNLQEMFLRNRLKAYAVMRNRMRVRITQAVGRCTRDRNDFALVLCEGKDLGGWCSNTTNTQGLHPELQAEIAFGLDISEALDGATARQMLDAFFAQSKEWKESGDPTIRKRAKGMKKVASDETGSLAKAAEHESQYIYRLWKEDYVRAHESAAAVSDLLMDQSLRPYRAFWEYLAACAADAAYRASKDDIWLQTFRRHVDLATTLSSGVRWLAALSFLHPTAAPADAAPLGVDEICELLEEWAVRGTRFVQCLEAAREQIQSKEAAPFQRGLATLGRMLGFATKNYPGTHGAPDSVWCTEDGHHYVFEAKSNESPGHAVSFDTVRQAYAHPKWIKTNDKELLPARESTVIVVSPRSKLSNEAKALSTGVTYLSLDDVVKLFENAAACFHAVRARAIGPTEEELRELIVDTYRKAGLTGESLLARVFGKKLDSLPIAY